MATNLSVLPLAIIYNGAVYRNHILRLNNKQISFTPFDEECEATRFISSFLLVANNNVISHLKNLPLVGERYARVSELVEYLSSHNLFATNDEEPTLISISPSGYHIFE